MLVTKIASLLIALVYLCTAQAYASEIKSGQIVPLVNKKNTNITKKNQYYTRQELENIYRKKYAQKMPYDFKFGKVEKVSFGDDGTVYITAVASPIYIEMPMLARMMLTQKLVPEIERNYCKQIAKGREPYAKIRRGEGYFVDASGGELLHLSYYPELCRGNK